MIICLHKFGMDCEPGHLITLVLLPRQVYFDAGHVEILKSVMYISYICHTLCRTSRDFEIFSGSVS